MASAVINMIRLRSLFIRYRRLNRFSSSPIISTRSLYSQEALGITIYIDQRKRTAVHLLNLQDKFTERMASYVEDPEKYEIFIDDVKNLINVIKNKNDIELCCQVLKQFKKQAKDTSFQQIGLRMMRCCHYLQYPDVAFEFLKDEEYDGIFNQVSSFVIAMDLLLETGNYQKLLEVFEILKKKQLHRFRFHPNALNIAFACYYKINTPESYKCAVQLLKDAPLIPRRAFLFAAALALKQNDPQNTLEILKNKKFYAVQNFRLMSFAELDRLEEVFIILNGILFKDYVTKSNYETIFPEIIEKLEAAAARNGKKEIVHKMKKMIQSLKGSSHIMSSSIDEFLFEPILPKDEQPPQDNLDTSNRSQNRYKYGSLYSME